ncbi:outer membrane beta-barrel family protein [Heminiphilus faecis]|uniref:outer membrane beta-barrel family protein n=1 Tax=Heminiphilus faecis TaxID=2601703 RepID=UPI001248B963|nr:outer membrane beta-barrel family protein [Heminiphilus faecis]
MKKVFCLLLLVSMATICANAQYKVSGEVVDSTGTSESYVTVRIYKDADMTKPIAIGTSDIDGNFTQTLPSAGDYILRITSVGKTPSEIKFSLHPAHRTKDFGKIVMRMSENTLGEVEVIAQRPLVVSEVDRISYDVQGDEDSKTSTIIEMLRKVPMVTVDGNNEIRVKGEANFKIYKNGKPNNSFTNNPKEVLSSIPASMIKRIEVITEPGAKYDAEGVGGILNIVTIDNMKVKGVIGNLFASYDTKGTPNMGAYLTTQIDKFTASVNYGYFGISEKATRNNTVSEYLYRQSGDTQRYEDTSTSKGYGNYMSFEASYEPDSLNLITAAFDGFFYKVKPTGTSTTSFFNNAGERLYGYSDRFHFPDFNNYNFAGKVDYQRLTRHKGESIVLSYLLNTTTNKSTQYNELDDLFNPPFDYTSYYTDNNQHFWEHTFQADYTRPFGSKHKINAGAKYILRDNSSNTEQRYDNSATNATDFSHNTQVAALYAEYMFNTGPVGARAGVRYEYSYLAAKFKDGKTPDFHQDLNDIVPTIGANWRINPANSLNLTFGSRINRPGISYLNPAVIATPNSVSQGNPDLSSAHSYSFRLSYMLMKPKITLNASTDYVFCNEQITQISEVRDNIIYNSYGNVGHARRLSCNGYIQWRATQKTSIMVNASGGYSKLANPSLGLSNSRWTWGFYAQASQQLPWMLRIEALGGRFSSGINDLYGRTSAMYFHSITLSRSFLKENRLSVRINAQNPFGSSNMRIKSYRTGGDYIGSAIISRHQRAVSVTVSWRFGSLNAQVKKTVKTISNDDIVGGAQTGASGNNGSNTQN